jgi:hypothetical protein
MRCLFAREALFNVAASVPAQSLTQWSIVTKLYNRLRQGEMILRLNEDACPRFLDDLAGLSIHA